MALSSLSLSLSLSSRLWIPQVRGQPHGFSFSIQLDSWHPPRWAAGPPSCAWRRRSISFSVFLCSVVHLCLPPRSAWHNHPLLAVVYAHTISAWPQASSITKCKLIKTISHKFILRMYYDDWFEQVEYTICLTRNSSKLHFCYLLFTRN